MLYVINLSTLKTCNLYRCPYLCHCCCHSFAVVPPTTYPVPQHPNHVVCPYNFVIVSVVPFSTNKNVFSCFQTLLVEDTFVTKARFYRFLLRQTQSKRDGNVCEKARRTLFTVSLVLDISACPSSQELGRGCGLAASYT